MDRAPHGDHEPRTCCARSTHSGELLKERNHQLVRWARANLCAASRELLPYRAWMKVAPPARHPPVGRAPHRSTAGRPPRRGKREHRDKGAGGALGALRQPPPRAVICLRLRRSPRHEDKWERLCAQGHSPRLRRRSLFTSDRSPATRSASSTPTTSIMEEVGPGPPASSRCSLIHEDTEIRDDRFEEKLRWALNDPDVAIVGTIGAVGVQGIDWGLYDYGSGSSILEPIDPAVLYETPLLEGSELSGAGGFGDVDMVDGYLHGHVALGDQGAALRRDRGRPRLPRLRRRHLLSGARAGQRVSRGAAVAHHRNSSRRPLPRGWLRAQIAFRRKWEPRGLLGPPRLPLPPSYRGRRSRRGRISSGGCRRALIGTERTRRSASPSGRACARRPAAADRARASPAYLAARAR